MNCTCEILTAEAGKWHCATCGADWEIVPPRPLDFLNPTASSLERALECPASVVLPGVVESSDYAERGHVIHTFVRNVIAGADHAAELAKVVDPAHRATCAAIRFKDLVGDLTNVRAEVSYALDVEDETARVLGLNLGRKYPSLTRTQFAGTNDWEGLRLDGMPVADDLKTGWERVTPCKYNVQAKFHSRAIQLVTGAAEVEGRISYLDSDGSVDVDSHVFTAFELDSFGDELVELPIRIDHARRVYAMTGQVTVKSGDWCKYCPAMPACPKYTALARTMATDIDAIKGRLLIMTPDEQGIAWQRRTEIKNMLEVVDDGLKAIAREHPIPLPDGRKEVRSTDSHSRSFDAGRARALLAEKGATEAEILKTMNELDALAPA